MDAISKSPHDPNNLVIAGKFIEALEKYYNDDVVMQENNGDPVIRKEVNHLRGIEFPDNVIKFRKAAAIRLHPLGMGRTQLHAGSGTAPEKRSHCAGTIPLRKLTIT